ncbi:MAG: 3-deoxy-7-phosphoheptulonate synthase [Dehalococcoidia bacterium]|nr:MAG: 3-deoxy-7-phosphoheptulonate synthase [Dehalococcoidia bacterium]
MIIMKADATEEQIEKVVEEIKKCGLRADVSTGAYRTVIGLVGDEGKVSFDHFAVLPGVKEAMRVEIPYKLISREYSKLFEGAGESMVIKVGSIAIGGDEPIFIAGPCAVESKEQLFRIAEGIKKAGAHILRGGIFKPRSSVHSFQGLGAGGQDEAREALSWLGEAGRKFDMPVITEVRGETQVDLVSEYVDILQIGARNMYDQDLLTKMAKKGKPILFKRHFGAGIEEFLSFAEYIAAEGNKDIILCERGILPVGKGKNYTRYTLDLAAIPAIQKETYLPVMADPSHGTGRRDLIFSMSCAAIAAGASGLMVEVHYDPAEALVDGPQAITPDELKEVIDACQRIHQLVASGKADEKG